MYFVAKILLALFVLDVLYYYPYQIYKSNDEFSIFFVLTHSPFTWEKNRIFVDLGTKDSIEIPYHVNTLVVNIANYFVDSDVISLSLLWLIS